ncbi:photoreceptor ankyrin repeat protein [Lemur catta]|uniref:photoreceptor ankyrin repeat protein n=1 Tax=Lemur catta TaxID=9447 RepID=UPI001E26C15F|nr:photoreceptor ankyrin repeat protein [Lemur catta]
MALSSDGENGGHSPVRIMVGGRGHDLWQVTLDPQKGPELGSEATSSILCPTPLSVVSSSKDTGRVETQPGELDIGPKLEPHHLLLGTCSAKTLPLHLAPEPSAIASSLRSGDALSIPAQGCHLLATSGLAETGPWQKLGVAVPQDDCLLETFQTPAACGQGPCLLAPRLEEKERPLHRGRLDMSEALSCPGNKPPAPGCRLGALYWACAHNDSTQLQAILDGGVSPEEATQVDRNGRTGLMVACYHGFGNVVALLSRCSFLDVNQQDKDGNTALMLAAQAGHAPLVSLLINYYAGLDLERRDQRGLTALMKAAIRDRSECADLTAVDPVRGKTALEWAVLTDSFDTVWRIRQLLRRPQAEQLSQHYQPEWPALAGLVAQAQAQTQAAPSLLERLQGALSLPFGQSPQEGGVLDHLVTLTTSLASPFLTTACHTLCPDHPPTLGTRSKSVPELLGTAPPPPPAPSPPLVVSGPRVFVPYQSPQGILSVCPQWLQPRDSTSPRPQVPKILLSKASSSSYQRKPNPSPTGNRCLALPLWRYQQLRMERRRQEEG